MSWRAFVEDLDAREYEASNQRSTDVILNNVRQLDALRRTHPLRCKAPGCDYMLESVGTCYAVADIGNLCSLCWHMYYALKYIKLKDGLYFVKLHREWKALSGRKPDTGIGGQSGFQT
jgi:hypothetical protein